MLGASVGAAGLATACLSTLARASRSGAWSEVRTAARITGTRTMNCGELGGGSSYEAGTALRTALANAAGVAWRLRSLVAIHRRVGRDRMKPPSLTAWSRLRRPGPGQRALLAVRGWGGRIRWRGSGIQAVWGPWQPACPGKLVRGYWRQRRGGVATSRWGGCLCLCGTVPTLG